MPELENRKKLKNEQALKVDRDILYGKALPEQNSTLSGDRFLALHGGGQIRIFEFCFGLNKVIAPQYFQEIIHLGP